jgi:hypothetical protein
LGHVRLSSSAKSGLGKDANQAGNPGKLGLQIRQLRLGESGNKALKMRQLKLATGKSGLGK